MSGSFPDLRLKYLADKIGSGKTPLGGAQAYVPTGVMFLRSQNVHFDGLHLDDVVFIDEDTDAEMASTRVEPEDVLLNITGASLGRCTLFPATSQRGNVNQHVCIIRPSRRQLLPSYLNSVMQSALVQSQIFAGENGSSREGLTFEQIGNFAIPLPSLPQQRAIADYLNRETARLDALVAAKERVLGLLAEKRRTLITRAVTRGLDPRAPLRDSGIPWLGEIPAHWRVERLKFHLHWIEQGWSPSCDSTPAALEEWAVLKAGCVNGWDFDPGENKRLPDVIEPLPQYEVRHGDVLMSRANTTALLGSTALVGEVRPRLLLCDKLYRLGVNDATLWREYLVAFLRSPVGRYEFERDATGASNSMQNIGQDSVRNLWLPIPPIKEQHSIVGHIKASTVKLEAMRIATEHTVRLLKERRAARIAAAVTGQQSPVPRLADLSNR